VIANLDYKATVSYWIKVAPDVNVSRNQFICSSCVNGTNAARFTLLLVGWLANQQQAVTSTYYAGDRNSPLMNVISYQYSTNPNGYLSWDTLKNQWTHFALVKDANAGTMKMYINGELVALTTDANQPIGASGENFTSLRIGEHCIYNAYYPFKGWLDDFRIYDVALSQAEIATLAGYSPGASLNQPSLAWSDINRDSRVNFRDFARLCEYWMETALWP